MFYYPNHVESFLKRVDKLTNTNIDSIHSNTNTLEDFEKAFKKKYGIDFEVFVKKFKEQFPEEML